MLVNFSGCPTERKLAFSNTQQWWDFGRVQVRQLCQQLTRSITMALARKIKDLERQVRELNISVASTENMGLLNALKSKKLALTNMLGVSAQGTLVRSRFMISSQKDAPSFLSTCSGCSDSFEIRKYTAGFYKNLYTSEWSSNPDVQDKDIP